MNTAPANSCCVLTTFHVHSFVHQRPPCTGPKTTVTRACWCYPATANPVYLSSPHHTRFYSTILRLIMIWSTAVEPGALLGLCNSSERSCRRLQMLIFTQRTCADVLHTVSTLWSLFVKMAHNKDRVPKAVQSANLSMRVPSKMAQRICVWFSMKCGDQPAETVQKMRCFPQDCYLKPTVCCWHKSFREGRTKLGDLFRGCHCLKRTDQNNQKCARVLEDPDVRASTRLPTKLLSVTVQRRGFSTAIWS